MRFVITALLALAAPLSSASGSASQAGALGTALRVGAATPPGVPAKLLLRGDRLLVGTDRGLYAHGGSASGWRLLLARGAVRGLAAGPHGVLVATASGLYEWSDAGVRSVPLGAGANVTGVAVISSGEAWATTDAGLFQRPGNLP